MSKKILMTIISFIFLVGTASAGWIVVEELDGEKSFLYFGENKVRFESDGMIQILDIEKERLCLIDPSKKIYWMGQPSEIREKIAGVMEAAIKNLPEEQKKAWKEAMESQKQSGGKSMDVRTKKTDDKQTIAGHETRKYEIFSAGELKEELWLAADVTPAKDIDFKKMGQMMKAVAEGDPEGEYEYAPQVMDLYKKGYPLRRIVHEDGGMSKEEVVRVEKKRLGDDLFKPPASYRKANLTNLMSDM